MDLSLEKDPGLIPQVLAKILDASINGITLADPDQNDIPLVYVNKAFEVMTGYSFDETVGKNCRFLQGNDKNQPEINMLRKALKEKSSVNVTLRNYKKNGQLFYNQLLIQPLFDNKNNLLYYLGVQFDITEKINKNKEIEALIKKVQDLNG
ncbi:MAG TPA: PAS domain-containing protein [Nitrosomonas sp.]|nr:PAS domain-containing protein [Nitrosomonas sp.]HRB33063.1 PAS domain-containing protein [Nitrosomonas sp.]HRB46294.1 PAS domain-containing protein [Nitrosomonas sp.]HRB78140.1 PAS domain-containing protein [Nitrosomonas sp.]